MIFFILGVFLILCGDIALVSLIHEYASKNNEPIIWEASLIVVINIVFFFPLIIKLLAWRKLLNLAKKGEIEIPPSKSDKIETKNNNSPAPIGAKIWLFCIFCLLSLAAVLCAYAVFSPDIFKGFPFIFLVTVKIATGVLGVLAAYAASMLLLCIISEMKNLFIKRKSSSTQ
jgi:hypothetical protein